MFWKKGKKLPREIRVLNNVRKIWVRIFVNGRELISVSKRAKEIETCTK